MTPLQKIKSGILNNDMILVAEGYNALCLDKVHASDIPVNKPPVLRQEPVPSHYQSPQPYQVPTQASEARQKQPCRVEPFVPKKRVNMWADDKTEPTPGYTSVDRQQDEQTRHIRKSTRPPYKPVRVTCDSCGRLFDVNPIFTVNNSYRCEGCVNGR